MSSKIKVDMSLRGQNTAVQNSERPLEFLIKQ